MKGMKFSDVAVGSTFQYGGQTYKKTCATRATCGGKAVNFRGNDRVHAYP